MRRARVFAADGVNWVSFSSSFMLNFLIARLSASQICKRWTQLGFLHRNASHIFNSFSSAVKLSESNKTKRKQEGNESFTVSYLMNSLGLSSKVAIDLSKRVKLKYADKPDSVLNVFRSYGFSDTQIFKIVKKYPAVLLTNPENTLLPKLRFFESIGFSWSELPQLLISNSRLLAWSLKERIIPGYEVLKSVIDDDKEVHITRKHNGWGFLHFDLVNVVPNIKVLREHGVPQSSVNLLLNNFTSVAFINHAKFVEHVKFAKDMGIKPFTTTFIQSIYVLSMTKKSTWEAKLNVYERCGWSRDVTISTFGKFPYCMLLSEEKITSSMKFLVDQMGFSLNDISKFPAALGYSLKRRIIPRYSVVRILKMKGLINNYISLSSFLRLSEKKFREKFVVRFQESVPELLNIYQGQSGP